MSNTDTLVDPARPWIHDPRDAPANMNWLETLLNPFGVTSKVHFARAWTLMFMARLLLFIVPVFAVFILGIAGMEAEGMWKPVEGFGLPVPLLLMPFFVFAFVTEFTSFVAHRRRLANAKRSSWLSILVLVPLILAMAGFVVGTGSGAKAYDALQAEKNKPQIEQTVGDGDTAAPAPESNDQTQRRKKRKGPPPTQKEMAASAGMNMAIPIWMLSSFFVMLWSLLYVARLPNDGIGKIQTGTSETA